MWFDNQALGGEKLKLHTAKAVGFPGVVSSVSDAKSRLAFPLTWR